jgi:hypothetical protein
LKTVSKLQTFPGAPTSPPRIALMTFLASSREG